MSTINRYNRDCLGKPGVPMEIAAGLVARNPDSLVKLLRVGILDVRVGDSRRYSVTLMPLVDGVSDGQWVYDIGSKEFIDAYRAFMLLLEFLRRYNRRIPEHRLRDYVRAAHLAFGDRHSPDADDYTDVAMREIRSVVSVANWWRIGTIKQGEVGDELLSRVRRARQH